MAKRRAARMMTQVQCAEFLGVTDQTLRTWNKNGEGPPKELKGKRYYYVREAITDWLARGAPCELHGGALIAPAPAPNGSPLSASSAAHRDSLRRAR